MLRDSKLASSVAEARRLIAQGAVQKVTQGGNETVVDRYVELKDGDLFRVGKHRFLRIVDTDKGG